jgi:pentatricopeptide repeat protein
LSEDEDVGLKGWLFGPKGKEKKAERERRLAAIMFTDLVSYTALGQRNESLSLALVEEQRKLIRPILARHNGVEIKTMGDAFLVEFPNALDAVNCAYDIQRATREFNIPLSPEKRIHLRVGLHLGDVVEFEGDISGDAVNVASRIEPLAEDGGVCLTRQVYDHVSNKFELPLTSLGPKALKNVTEPVEVFKVVMPWEQSATAKAPTFPTYRIAILPFASFSSNPDDAYFADGVTDEIISAVAGISGLNVISRTSVVGYKGTTKRVEEIGRELKVGSILEGTFKKAGNKIRVTTQLINVAEDRHLWAQNYDGTIDDIFAVQSEIAAKVAGELKVQLLDSERQTISKKPTEDTVAYAYYLQGKQLLSRMEEAPLRDALSFFEQALARDPRFAKAQVGIADCYRLLANYGYISWQEGDKRTRKAALKALEMEPGLAEAHYSLANAMYSANEIMESLRELRKALELNPNMAEGYLDLTDELAAMGDTQEMVGAAEKAYELDPLSSRAVAYLGNAYFWTGRGEEAMEHWKKTLHLDPFRTYRCMFDYYANRGEYEEAGKTVKEMERISPDSQYTLLNRGYLAALTGDEKTARDMIARLEEKGAGWAAASLAGFIYLPLGDMDRFFEYMFRAAENGTLFASVLRCNPLFEKARKDPRFGEAFRRANLPYGPES